MESSMNSQMRVLAIYDQLVNGKSIYKKEAEELFGVSARTIQRDIQCIRHYLHDSYPEKEVTDTFDRNEKVYTLQNNSTDVFTDEEILAISKVLVESRAFPKKDMDFLLKKMFQQAKGPNKKIVKTLLLNEMHLYDSLHHHQSLFDRLLELGKAIHFKKVITIQYQKEKQVDTVKRTLKPVGLIFSEYYFYLLAYQMNRNLDFPTIYRVDRIESCHVTEEHFRVEHKNRFEEGEFRKRIQFMYAGDLMKVRFRFSGPSIQAVLDRFPISRYEKEEDSDSYMVEVETFGKKGIQMWLLSQGMHVQVLEPLSFKEEIKKVVEKMLEGYR